MKRKLASLALAGALLQLAPVAARAQTPAPEARPAVVVQPDIVVAPEVRIPGLGTIIPQVRVEMPEINIAPIAVEVPDININIDGDDFWFDGAEQIERVELKQSYPLSAGARVELTNIDGSVRVEPTDGQAAEVRVNSYSAYDNPRKLTVEASGNSLSLRGPEPGVRRYDDTRHSVTLKLPRRVELIVTNARESVQVGDMEGPVRLQGVSGNVSVAQATGGAEITKVSGTVVMNLARLAQPGVRVQDVKGSVSLRFLDELNAELQTTNIKGKVYVEVPNVAVEGEMSRSDVRAKIGTGGPAISVSDVAGSVKLARGRTVAELLADFKAGGRSSARANTVRDLAMHASLAQARAALVEALQGEENGSVQATAARALTPYVGEPEVRAAFLKAADAGRSDSTRATVMRALARNYAGDRAVRDLLLRALASDRSNSVRQTAAGALAKEVDDPAVQRAFMEALRQDANDSVRLRAAGALAKRADDAEVYALLLETAKNDRKRSIRARALDALAPRLPARAELRPVFVGYLDDESVSMQYHALKGLVGLNDAALRPRLVEKSRELILLNGRRYWNDQLVLNTVLLLRRLDPQEADRALEQLTVERARAARF
ncbi:MAG TPA: HEAT repeat domain-containing protein [Pyrinomonadaceae bacterium]|jgi:hypothetical protein